MTSLDEILLKNKPLSMRPH